MYAGDEFYDDEVTSGPLANEDDDDICLNGANCDAVNCPDHGYDEDPDDARQLTAEQAYRENVEGQEARAWQERSGR